MKQSELSNILKLHQKWLVGEENGVQANLHGALPANVSYALNNLTEKEQNEVLAEFAKWGLENEKD